MFSHYRDYLEKLNTDLKREGFDLQVSLDASTQDGLTEAITTMNMFFGINNLLKYGGSAQVYKGVYNKTSIGWIRDKCQEQYNDEWNEKLQALYKQPKEAGVITKSVVGISDFLNMIEPEVENAEKISEFNEKIGLGVQENQVSDSTSQDGATLNSVSYGNNSLWFLNSGGSDVDIPDDDDELSEEDYIDETPEEPQEESLESEYEYYGEEEPYDEEESVEEFSESEYEYYGEEEPYDEEESVEESSESEYEYYGEEEPYDEEESVEESDEDLYEIDDYTEESNNSNSDSDEDLYEIDDYDEELNEPIDNGYYDNEEDDYYEEDNEVGGTAVETSNPYETYEEEYDEDYYEEEPTEESYESDEDYYEEEELTEESDEDYEVESDEDLYEEELAEESDEDYEVDDYFEEESDEDFYGSEEDDDSPSMDDFMVPDEMLSTGGNMQLSANKPVVDYHSSANSLADGLVRGVNKTLGWLSKFIKF